MCNSVTVITPFYRGNKFIPQLLGCIEKNVNVVNEKENKHFIVNLLIINDSPDVKVIIPPIKYSFNIKIINQEKNMGIHQARVTGLLNTDAEFVLFLDQDDVILDNFLIDQIENIGTNDIIVANAYIENNNYTMKKLYRSNYEFGKVLNKEFYLKSHNMIVSPGQCLIKRKAIPKEWCINIIKNNGSDDLYLWLLLLSLACKFKINDKCLYIHKYTGDNLSVERDRMATSSCEIGQILSGNVKSAISKRDINVLIKSREFGLKQSHTKGIRKILLYIKNIDIVIPRVIWKILTIMSLWGSRRNNE